MIPRPHQGDINALERQLRKYKSNSDQALLEYQNHYRGLEGRSIDLVTHSRIDWQEINGRQVLMLELVHEPIPGKFKGFAAVEGFGLCVMLAKLDSYDPCPLRDVEDIWEG